MYACSLSTTPTLLACADVTVHAQAQCWKGSSGHYTALYVVVLQYYTTVTVALGMCSIEL